MYKIIEYCLNKADLLKERIFSKNSLEGKIERVDIENNRPVVVSSSEDGKKAWKTYISEMPKWLYNTKNS